MTFKTTDVLVSKIKLNLIHIYNFWIFLVSGPPKTLSLLRKNENTLKINWEPPEVSNGAISEYHVGATPVSSYSLSTVALPMEWTFQNTTYTIDLLGLQPGTQYNITVRAKTMDGYGIPISDIFNTEIGGIFSGVGINFCTRPFFCL